MNCCVTLSVHLDTYNRFGSRLHARTCIYRRPFQPKFCRTKNCSIPMNECLLLKSDQNNPNPRKTESTKSKSYNFWNFLAWPTVAVLNDGINFYSYTILYIYIYICWEITTATGAFCFTCDFINCVNNFTSSCEYPKQHVLSSASILYCKHDQAWYRSAVLL